MAVAIAGRGEAGLGGFRIGGRFALGLEREHSGQVRFQLAHDIVELLLIDSRGGIECDIGIGEGHRTRAEIADRLDRHLRGLGPIRRRGAHADGAGQRAFRACRAGGGQDAVACALVIGGAGVEMRAFLFVDEEAQGEGGDHGARRGDIEAELEIGGAAACERRLHPAFLGGAVGDRLNRDLAGGDGHFRARQRLDRGHRELHRLVPAAGHRVIGALQHVGNAILARDFREFLDDRIAVDRRGHQPDQRDAVLVAQHFQREGGGRDRLGDLRVGIVDDPRAVDVFVDLGDRAEALGLGRGGAGEEDLQPVGMDPHPAVALRLHRDAHFLFRGFLDNGRSAARNDCGHDECEDKGGDRQQGGAAAHRSQALPRGIFIPFP